MTATPARPASDNLALVFQEILTAIVRIRSNRQAVSDAASFRLHIRESLKAAEPQARQRGYDSDNVRLAVFAVVAFLDESILNSRNPIFADWLRKPLQEEIFGGHVAGETFFQNIDKLLTQNESDALADVLEIYYLCLLLGYGGRYSGSGKGELRSIRESVGEKIRRIRGYSPEISPAWKPPTLGFHRQSDPWFRRLLYTAVACLGIALILFTAFKVSLIGGASELRSLAAERR